MSVYEIGSLQLMKQSIKFNFKQLQKKYTPKDTAKEKEEQQGQKLILKQDLPTNPLVLQEIAKLEKDYVTYYNNNRNFYLHTDPENVDIIEKIKNDQFHQIRKQYEKKPYALQKKVSQKIKQIIEAPPKKKFSRVQKQLKFKHLSYLFRKNIKFIIAKLKSLKITVKDIFEKDLFSSSAYRYGKDIFQAVKFGQQTKVWRYCIQNKFVIYSIDSSGKTPLVWACIRGYSNIAQMLINMGVLINKKDILGHTALYYAIHHKQIQCIKVLVLNDAIISNEHVELSLEQKKIKNIIQLSLSVIKIIRNMPYEKRTKVFQDNLRQIN